MKTLVAIPCMDMVHTAFCRSLVGLRPVGDAVEYRFSQNSLVYDSRNQIAEYAITNRFDRVLWLDSDMTFEPDLMARLANDLDAGREMVSCLYTTRKTNITPCIYKKITPSGRHGLPEAHSFTDYPKDTIFEVAGCGFGAVMMETELIHDVMRQYGYMFSPIIGMGEDLSFCFRVSSLGKKMFCDSRIKCGHIGQIEYNETHLKV